jgi:hypothetical protein
MPLMDPVFGGVRDALLADRKKNARAPVSPGVVQPIDHHRLIEKTHPTWLKHIDHCRKNRWESS